MDLHYSYPSDNESPYLWKQVSLGFTIMELLIAMAIIALVAFIAFFLVNPKKQLDKVQDTRRKQEFAILQRVFDDFYNDNESYPLNNDVCYDPVIEENGICSCHICGLANEDTPFSSYLKRLYCDPEYPRKEYLYQYECEGANPSWYRVCGVLSEKQEENPGYYNYGVASPNQSPAACLAAVYDSAAASSGSGSGFSGGVSSPTPTPLEEGGGSSGPNSPTFTPTPTIHYCPFDPSAKFCIKDAICNVCGTEDNCKQPEACDEPYQLYSDYLCTTACY